MYFKKIEEHCVQQHNIKIILKSLETGNNPIIHEEENKIIVFSNNWIHFNNECELTMWQTTWLRAEFPRQHAQWKQKAANKHLECNLVQKTLEYNIWGKLRAVRIQAIGSFRAMTKSKQSQGVHRFHFQTPNQAASWIPAKATENPL